MIWQCPSSFRTYDGQWSFGQVVAVAVWLPMLFSFINDWIYGLRRRRTNQLPASLQVVRTNTLDTLPTHLTNQGSDRTSSDSSLAPIMSKTPAGTGRSSMELQVLASEGSGTDLMGSYN